LGAIVHEMLQGFKAFWARRREEITLVSVILMVSFLSFSLGRFSATESTSHTQALQQETTAAVKTSTGEATQFVALKTGSVYYSVLCKGAEKLDEARRVYFDSPAEAEASGYTLARGCVR